MRSRRWLGALLAAIFVALVVHETSATQCPAREQGACAKVHALMLAKPRLVAAPVAEPMTGRRVEVAMVAGSTTAAFTQLASISGR